MCFRDRLRRELTNMLSGLSSWQIDCECSPCSA